jgi:hypothetical protein
MQKLPSIWGKVQAKITRGKKEQSITLHLGQNISKNYPPPRAKTKQKILLLGQNISKNYPASGPKHKQKLPCIWAKT